MRQRAMPRLCSRAAGEGLSGWPEGGGIAGQREGTADRGNRKVVGGPCD